MNQSIDCLRELLDDKSVSGMPICVDLDGTLIAEDISYLAFREFIRSDWRNIFKCVFWLLRGTSYCKYELSKCQPIPIEKIHYNCELMEELKKRKGFSPIILATGAPQVYAEHLAKVIGVFDEVLASTSEINFVREEKAKKLVEKFGEKKFIYIADSDLAVWVKALGGIIVKCKNGVWNFQKFGFAKS